MRVLLILVDGMRPDAIEKNERVKNFMKKSSYTMKARTVFPSVTLPCHMSLFHSVDPTRHGTTTNVYTPQVRPIDGICEVLLKNGKKSAFFYNWEELRDLARPNSLTYSYFVKGRDLGYDNANNMVTAEAIDVLTNNHVDFAFLYMGYVDEAGHKYGWMSDEYMGAIENSWDNIEKITNVLPDDYTVIVIADHGGHDRIHGTEAEEDMTIPVIIKGKDFEEGKELENISIKDIAPTVAKLLGVDADKEWEGKEIK